MSRRSSAKCTQRSARARTLWCAPRRALPVLALTSCRCSLASLISPPPPLPRPLLLPPLLPPPPLPCPLILLPSSWPRPVLTATSFLPFSPPSRHLSLTPSSRVAPLSPRSAPLLRARPPLLLPCLAVCCNTP